jgi:hypothetical protein
MKTNKRLWSYLAQFFLEWEVFQTEVVDETKIHFTFNNFFWKSCHLRDNVKKYGGVGQVTDDSTARALCIPDN